MARPKGSKNKSTKTLLTGRKAGSGHHDAPRCGRKPLPEGLVRLSVQLPAELKNKIRELARINKTSMSATIVDLLQKGL